MASLSEWGNKFKKLKDCNHLLMIHVLVMRSECVAQSLLLHDLTDTNCSRCLPEFSVLIKYHTYFLSEEQTQKGNWK